MLSDLTLSGFRCFRELHVGKLARVNLFVGSKPGLPFGLALNARVLGHDSPEAASFVAWFMRLFLD